MHILKTKKTIKVLMLEIFFLSLIQGITEFLPISSSAHLLLASKYLNINNDNLTIDISLHLGSLLAVILFFKDEIISFISNKSLLVKILIGSVPTMIFGFLLIKFNLISYLRDINIIAITTIFFGILLYFADKSKEKKTIEKNFSFKDSIYIGLLQIISLIPGVSRSGITITAARFLKFDRIESAKISFLLSIPTLMAASSYTFFKIFEQKNLEITTLNFLAIILSFLISYLTLKIFVRLLKKFSLLFFVYYRILFGIFILISLK